MAPPALVANLATRWRHLHKLQIWPPRWRHLHKLQIWPPDGATCISCKFGQKVQSDLGPLELVANLATRWRHLAFANENMSTMWYWCLIHCLHILVTRWSYLHWLQIWPPGGTTCISCKLGPQVAQLALVQNLVISWHHLHCFQSWAPVILALLHCLRLPYWHNLHWFKIWTWGGPTCIGSKVGHQVASMHCHIALNCPIDIIS